MDRQNCLRPSARAPPPPLLGRLNRRQCNSIPPLFHRAGAAQGELGTDTPIAEITRADFIRFTERPRVTLLRGGKPKPQPSIDNFASACPDCAKTAGQEEALDAQPTATEESAAKRAPRASKKRRGAIPLEVSQPEAQTEAS